MNSLEKFKNFIEENNLIEKGDSIVSAVSGGSDSVFMLEMLLAIKDDYNLKIIVSHVNHGLRGAEAQRDEDFVKRLAEKNGLIYEVEHIDMAGYAKEHSLTCEEAGRKLRYLFFEEIKEKYKADKVAIAHNENDVAETTFLNIFRGTGLDGLESIPLRRDFYIRPILCFEKSEILDFLKENNIHYVDDSTNFTNDYKRNMIRNEIIPFIKKNFNENIVSSMSRLTSIAKENNLYLDGIINDKYIDIVKANTIDREGFNELGHYEKTLVLRKFLRENLNYLNNISKDNIEDMINLISLDSGKKYDIDGKHYLVNDFDKTIFKKLDINELSEEISLDFKLDKVYNIYGSKFKFVLSDKILSKKYLDYDLLTGKLSLRNRRSGDRFNPFGMKGSKKIKDYFVDKKVSSDDRSKVLFLMNGDEIAYVVGYDIADKYRASSKTKNYLNVIMEGNDGL
ncbi:MAG: tRNA lysidine(34) synthetase TilS [Eubacteriales bacterium]|uniref:tRNA lysidine(34) synthetase TilS n=1 Tax=Fenollaria sp. TaxID=1965292 RepID=UPI002A75C176|nr:tRNA lysidine(34) synthetase TilS [Fenollaria sp.]MDD7340288.1 tRNA lysidine(34) synthetase TilS [Eubacteriales bacterium]MDY3105865.1 tRNA lysidine(34) synthetase TilS [Fenollaria sp.]